MPYLMLKEVPRYECLQEAADEGSGADPRNCDLFFNILHAGDVVSRAEAAFLAGHGLNQARLVVLCLLDGAGSGSMRSSEIAEKANVTRPTMTGLLDTMERAGWLARATDPHDRRAHNVKITASGEELLKTVRPRFMRWASDLFSDLSERERGQLLVLLRKTKNAIARPASQGAQATHA